MLNWFLGEIDWNLLKLFFEFIVFCLFFVFCCCCWLVFSCILLGEFLKFLNWELVLGGFILLIWVLLFENVDLLLLNEDDDDENIVLDDFIKVCGDIINLFCDEEKLELFLCVCCEFVFWLWFVVFVLKMLLSWDFCCWVCVFWDDCDDWKLFDWKVFEWVDWEGKVLVGCILGDFGILNGLWDVGMFFVVGLFGDWIMCFMGIIIFKFFSCFVSLFLWLFWILVFCVLNIFLFDCFLDLRVWLIGINMLIFCRGWRSCCWFWGIMCVFGDWFILGVIDCIILEEVEFCEEVGCCVVVFVDVGVGLIGIKILRFCNCLRK